jgi:hypothetical protein
MALRMYYFKGRNTPVVASSAKAARAKKKRGGNQIVAVRTPSAADRRAMRKGKWVTTRRDGKSKATSRYGKGRGQGPKRKR